MVYKSKKRVSELSDDSMDERSTGGQSKKTKTETTGNKSTSQLGANCKTDANGDRYWEISKNRRVTVSNFRGKMMVNIREYYEKDGQELPGKKGISLPMDQYTAFISLLPDLETALKENGQDVPRPNYASADPAEEGNGDDQEEADNDNEGSASPQKNVEAASEEEEEEEEEEE